MPVSRFSKTCYHSMNAPKQDHQTLFTQIRENRKAYALQHEYHSVILLDYIREDAQRDQVNMKTN